MQQKDVIQSLAVDGKYDLQRRDKCFGKFSKRVFIELIWIIGFRQMSEDKCWFCLHKSGYVDMIKGTEASREDIFKRWRKSERVGGCCCVPARSYFSAWECLRRGKFRVSY